MHTITSYPVSSREDTNLGDTISYVALVGTQNLNKSPIQRHRWAIDESLTSKIWPVGIDNPRELSMENLPKNALLNVATYLEKTPCALLAVAQSALSSLWERCDWSENLSRASKIVMSSPYYQRWHRDNEKRWEQLDLDDLDKSLRAKLTDGNVQRLRKKLESIVLTSRVNSSKRSRARVWCDAESTHWSYLFITKLVFL